MRQRGVLYGDRESYHHMCRQGSCLHAMLLFFRQS